MSPPTRPKLRVVQDSEEAFARGQRRLGERVQQLAYHWANKQIGPRGMLRLIEAFREVMPGVADTIILISGPAILSALGEQAITGQLDAEGTAFLSHILAPPKSPKTRSKEATLEGELQKIRRDLSLITKDWGLVMDPGRHVRIVGSPRMPTSIDISDGVILPHYDAVTVATIDLEEPMNELRLNAEFIVQAPRRIKWLLSLLDQPALLS